MNNAVKRTPAEAKPFLREMTNGKDEMNLVEMPIFLLSSRQIKGIDVLNFCVEDFDSTLKQVVHRKVTVIGDGVHGLPTAAAEKVYLALMHHARAYNNFSDHLVYFCRAELLLALCELRHARSVIQILTSRRREARLWRRRWLA